MPARGRPPPRRALGAPVPQAPPASNPEPPAPDASAGGIDASALDQISIDELLKQATFEDPAAAGPADGAGAAPDASGFKLPNFQQVMQDAQVSSIDLLRDVDQLGSVLAVLIALHHSAPVKARSTLAVLIAL